ncbi:hypothetical protein COU61_01545, partial [Candidatus Pacearchaeota archaeon CG10_big_fil_rev_8_21_14_0_10_35_13]
YNEEKDIRLCLESLKNQNYKNTEIIIIDDGSTDKTLEIVKSMGVSVMKQNHGGPGKARNLGAKNAKGEILVFVDADMHFPKDYINNLVRLIINDDKIIGTTHDYEIATNTDNKWGNLWGKVRVDKKNANEVRIFRAIRKEKFLGMGGFDSKYGYADDQTFWYKYGIMPTVAKNTTCYHKNPDSLEGTYKQARWIGMSWKERYGIFRIPIINRIIILGLRIMRPLLAMIKALMKNDKETNTKERIKYYNAKF